MVKVDQFPNTPLVPVAPDADIRSDAEFCPLTMLAAGSDTPDAPLDAEIVAVDDMGHWQYIRIGKNIHRRRPDQYVPSQWECYASAWPQRKEYTLSIRRLFDEQSIEDDKRNQEFERGLSCR